MKLQFKHQKFQADAAKAVCDVLAGQPFSNISYQIDPGKEKQQASLRTVLYTGFANAPITPKLTREILVSRIQSIQNVQLIKPSEKLEGHGLNLTIEMETGVGKTYTYIKTIYELNKLYGWSKFIIVVPSIAIREGVYKSFKDTADHFKEEYNKQIRFFIYNSKNLQDISQFASDSNINAMIINSQAFNARGKDARRMYSYLDEFNGRRPIDVIARTNPILIIDEPQSVEGKATKESLKDFNQLFTLRYSATHRKDSIYNMVYRLDAVEAYNQKLVKKIVVKGVTPSSISGTDGYLYLQDIALSPTKPPMAKIEIEIKGKDKIRRQVRLFEKGDNIYDYSNELEAYKDGYVISDINGIDNSVSFINGITLKIDEDIENVNEMQLRRIQIRETIISHLERERYLFKKGIKVLSLFFIDEVKHYKFYDENNIAYNGEFAQIFEDEYERISQDFIDDLANDEEYKQYLKNIAASKTHAGYFSVDKKTNRIIDSDISADKKNRLSNDVDAYDLIMKNKERLLDLKEPVRFIFSHSALREGWDNPNVFQICTLKQSSSEVTKRQEVGRGLRLCVDKDGKRMDQSVLGADVHNINVLTVIASESYEKFANTLQDEYAKCVSDRPLKIEKSLFVGRIAKTPEGEITISEDIAGKIYIDLVKNNYVDADGNLTQTYYDDKANESFAISDELKPYAESIKHVLSNVYNPEVLKPENANANNISLKVDEDKLARRDFKQLWEKINSKSAYCVEFDSKELLDKSVQSLDRNLTVAKNFYTVKSGTMERIDSKEALLKGEAFGAGKSKIESVDSTETNLKYDLVGRIAESTELTRKLVVDILKNIHKETFDQFRVNPEDFIIKVSDLINEQKATVIVQHIVYNKLDEKYDTSIFTESNLKGRLGKNAMETPRQLYNCLIWDSDKEKKFAAELEASSEVSIYVKLPKSFYINTPVGQYSPDWAIAFREDSGIKHIYFVAETKGNMDTLQLKEIEGAKIACARKHFESICPNEVTYDFVSTYKELLDKVMQ